MAFWARKIDINSILQSSQDWKETRDEVVKILSADEEFLSNCGTTIEDMKTAESSDEFDNALEEIYDYADRERIWMGP